MSLYLRFLAALALAIGVAILGSCASESITALDKTTPQDASTLVITVLASGINLAWTGSEEPDFLEYRISRSNRANYGFHQVKALTDTTWTDTAVEVGNSYYYEISAVHQSEADSTLSQLAFGAVPSLGLFQIDGGAEFTASTTIEVSILAEGGTSALIWSGARADSASGQEFTFQDGGLTVPQLDLSEGEGTKTLWARLHQFSEEGDFSTPVCYKYSIVLDQTSPDVLPQVVSPQDGSTTEKYRVRLQWTPGSDQLCSNLFYDVYLWVDGSPELQVYSGSNPNCHVSGLDYQTAYNWRVVVFDGAGNQADCPAWSFTADDDLVLIPAGSFVMGSPYGEPGRNINETQHTVTLSRGFYLSPHEVTEEIWDAVMGAGNSSSLHPKANVSWDSAIEFCNAISEHRGFTPVYTIAGSGQVTWNPQADGYRLLTEAEWEYACRAESQTALANGEITDTDCFDPLLDQIGRYCGNNENQSSLVGSLSPNAWGVYDMHGNVWEWCWDYYLGDHPASPVTDPVSGGYVQESTTVYRLIRGGNFFNNAASCRSAERTCSAPTHSGYGIGFRIARSTD
jgi:formylglycine-generating enzyme required for sulfatase activity